MHSRCQVLSPGYIKAKKIKYNTPDFNSLCVNSIHRKVRKIDLRHISNGLECRAKVFFYSSYFTLQNLLFIPPIKDFFDFTLITLILAMYLCI